jgi:2-polyprenyl-6-methoxyphenol hydroxylase-like FAD-dependent oxidoreductase
MTSPVEVEAHDVIVIGAGPVGLLLAGELAAAGIRPLVLERQPRPVDTPKANGVVGRAAEELRRRGVLRGTGLRVVRPTRFRYGPFTLELGMRRRPLHILPVPQRRLEVLLENRAVALGAVVLREHEVTRFVQNDVSVAVHAATADSEVTVHARYLVGCDGAHSFVRKGLGIGFPGTTSTSISRLARVTIPASAAIREGSGITIPGVGRLALFLPYLTDRGSVTIAPADALDRSAHSDVYIVGTREPRGDAEPSDDLGEAELRASLRRVLAVDLPFTTATGARSVVANSRQAERYRCGRAFLAGDAAHVFSAGGSALNIGLADAIVLAEVLTSALRGHDDDTALDAYEDRRNGPARRALAHTRIQAALEGADEAGDALRGVFAELLRDRTSARRLASLLEG